MLIGLVQVGLAFPAACAPGDGIAADRVWIGPMPFKGKRLLRDDYFGTLTDASKWPTVLSRAQVFKSYIMVLPSVPVPGKSEPELSDARMKQLAAFMREHGLEVAFEVGGLRMGKDKPVKGKWGKRVAAGEFRHLKRWLDAGGSIDYLSTDHAVMTNLGHRCYQGTDCGLTLEETIEEQVSYFEAMSKRIPGVKLGAIESLGFFHVEGLDGRKYPRTVKKLPVWRFEEYFDTLVAAMTRRGLTLDHFHIDYGFDGVHHEGRRRRLPGADFGRVLAVERYVQSKGVKAGVIVNAFHDRKVQQPDPAAASRQARDRTEHFFSDYLAAGGCAEHIVIQTWHPFPERTGPEDAAHTVLGIARDVLLLDVKGK